MAQVEFKPGERVLHPLFGAGVIRVVSGSGAQARLTVDFSSQIGTKKLVAGMANLRSSGSSASGSAAEAPASAWYEITRVTAYLPPQFRMQSAELSALLFKAAGSPILDAVARADSRTGRGAAGGR